MILLGFLLESFHIFVMVQGISLGQLLKNSPLVTGELFSSVLTATAYHPSGHGEKGLVGESNFSQEVEKGLLLLIASDTPGLQV